MTNAAETQGTKPSTKRSAEDRQKQRQERAQAYQEKTLSEIRELYPENSLLLIPMKPKENCRFRRVDLEMLARDCRRTTTHPREYVARGILEMLCAAQNPSSTIHGIQRERLIRRAQAYANKVVTENAEAFGEEVFKELCRWNWLMRGIGGQGTMTIGIVGACRKLDAKDRCPTGKERFTEERAQKILELNSRRLSLSHRLEKRRYFCNQCGSWHLTSKENK